MRGQINEISTTHSTLRVVANSQLNALPSSDNSYMACLLLGKHDKTRASLKLYCVCNATRLYFGKSMETSDAYIEKEHHWNTPFSLSDSKLPQCWWRASNTSKHYNIGPQIAHFACVLAAQTQQQHMLMTTVLAFLHQCVQYQNKVQKETTNKTVPCALK